MEFNGKIGEISIEPKTKRIIGLSFARVPVGFRCKRCAVFCCKLGSPKLLPCDIERLKRSGRNLDMFLDVSQSGVKSKKDGSCIFLSYDAKESVHKCSVYAYRPTFCRLYPFKFEESGRQSYTLSFIPCCNGLGTRSSEKVDEKFFARYLQGVLFDLIDSNAI